MKNIKLIIWSIFFYLATITFLLINGILWLQIIIKFYFGWSLIASFVIFFYLIIVFGLSILFMQFLLNRKMKVLFKQLIIFVFIGLITSGFLALNQQRQDVELSWPAPLIPMTDIIYFDEGLEGDYNLVGVFSKVKLTKLEQLFVLIDPHYDFTVHDKNDQLTPSEQNLGGMIAKKSSFQSAIIAGYQEARSNIDYQFKGHQVYFKYDFVNKDLAIGDLIIGINGFSLTKEEDLRLNILSIIKEAINQNTINTTTIDLKVIKLDQTVQTVTLNLHRINNQVMIGIGFFPIYEINSKVIVSEIPYAVSGPSGGLMMSLSIYDALTSKKLSKTFKIAGTGTIDIFGLVGPIGGVKQKVITAIHHGADYFFVPKGENAKDALLVAKLLKPKMQIIPVNSLTEAILFLEALDD